jgi:malonyl-CoA/methylmalonyl-CoA synthetase
MLFKNTNKTFFKNSIRFLIKLTNNPSRKRFFSTSCPLNFKPTRLDENINEKTFLHDRYSSFTYKKLLSLSNHLSQGLLNSLNKTDLNGEKIGVYCSNNYTYLISILAIWLANGVPFCLSKNYPIHFIEYFLNDSKCQLIINGTEPTSSISPDSNENEFSSMLKRKNVLNYKLPEAEFYTSEASPTNGVNNLKDLIHFLNSSERKRAQESFLLYTSGTSGPAKGCLITFNNLFSSIHTIVDAYKWSSSDFILNPLPLNHYSGLVYCLLTPFFVGAQADLMPKFNAELVWSKLLDMSSGINFFIGVPTIYTQLVGTYAKSEDLKRSYSKDRIRDTLKTKMRIIASGSAPLNVKTFNDWYELTSYNIVERYGMTEIGMALSNPYVETDGFRRLGGFVGRPFGDVRVRIVEEHSKDRVLVESDAENDRVFKAEESVLFGELQIYGPNVFKEYLNKPGQTMESFTKDGWFITGRLTNFLRFFF